MLFCFKAVTSSNTGGKHTVTQSISPSAHSDQTRHSPPPGQAGTAGSQQSGAGTGPRSPPQHRPRKRCRSPTPRAAARLPTAPRRSAPRAGPGAEPPEAPWGRRRPNGGGRRSAEVSAAPSAPPSPRTPAAAGRDAQARQPTRPRLPHGPRRLFPPPPPGPEAAAAGPARPGPPGAPYLPDAPLGRRRRHPGPRARPRAPRGGRDRYGGHTLCASPRCGPRHKARGAAREERRRRSR